MYVWKQKLKIIYPGGGAPKNFDSIPFVNVDTSTVAGLSRGQQLGVARSGMADVIVTPLIYEADSLFSLNKGRLFAIFRHPIDRATDMFYYTKMAHWESTYSPEIGAMSISQYANSHLVQNNWMTRQLSGILDGELTQAHLQAALEVLRTRILVGLYTEMDASLNRFEQYFGWTYRIDPQNQEGCRTRFVRRGIVHPQRRRKELDEDTEAFAAIYWQNQMDLEIYDYAVMLFREQDEFVVGIPDDARNVDATCCRCDVSKVEITLLFFTSAMNDLSLCI